MRHLKLVHNVSEPLIMTLMVGTLVLCETNEMVPFKCKDCDFYASKKPKIEKHWKATHEQQSLSGPLRKHSKKF